MPADNARPDRATPALGPTFALTVVLALAGVGLVMAAVMLVVEPRPIPGIRLSERQEGETAVYAATFAVLLPAALFAGPRLASAVRAMQSAAGLSVLVASLAGGLALVVLVTRSASLAGAGGDGTLLALSATWAIAAGIALRRSVRAPWPLLEHIARRKKALWAIAFVLVAMTPWTVTSLRSLSLLPLAIGAVAVTAVVALAWSGRVQLRPARATPAFDVLAAGLIVLTTLDLVVIRTEGPAPTTIEPFINSTAFFHANFLLGPANEVLGGGAMLVDVVCQYGVAPIYLVAGWFNLVPASYGTFGLLDGVLTSLWLLAGYAVLRMARCPSLLAGGALATAVVVLGLARVYPVGTLVQEGPLRFGLPMLVLLGWVGAARWPRWRHAGVAVSSCTVGLSSIWSLEGFALSAGTFAALAALDAAVAVRGERRRLLLGRLGVAAAACLGAHLLLAVATVALRGELPDWGQYADFLHAFLLGDLGQLTYDFSPWSPGIALGAIYVGSWVAIALVLLRGHPIVRRERPLLFALVGATTYGTLLYMYLVDRSADHVVPYVSLPALLICVLWLGALLRAPGVGPQLRAGALALCLSITVILFSAAWSTVESRVERTALAHLVPGGPSPGSALARLGDFPPIHAKTAAGERLLHRYMPGEESSLVVLRPDLRTEILLRTRRRDRLGLAYPIGESFVPEERLPRLRRAVRRLRPGTRMLVDREALSAVNESADVPLGELLTSFDSVLARLQLAGMREITSRFVLRPIYRGEAGYVVMRLERRG